MQYQVLENAFNLCSGNRVKEGEQMLKQLDNSKEYPLFLKGYIEQNISIMEKQSYVLRAIIELKNWSSKYKNMEQHQIVVYEEIMQQFLNNLLSILLSIKNQQQSKLMIEAIYNVSEILFPQKWPNYTLELLQFFNINNIDTAIRVTKLLYKTTQKYEYSVRSDELYLEIIHMCDTFHDALLILIQNIIRLQLNDQTTQIYELLKNVLKIVHSLLAQDIHPSFEDNLQLWLSQLSLVLKIEKSNIQDINTVIFKAKGECLKLILLYVVKYSQEFQFEGLIQQFSQEIWSSCVDVNNDKMILNALKYFKTLVNFQQFQQLFTSNIAQIMNTLIISNLKLQEQDIITFEEESQQFIIQYFEQSICIDKREATVQLLQQICKKYPEQFEQFVLGFLNQQYNQMDQQIVIINILCDGFCFGYNPNYGAIELKSGQECIQYFNNNNLKMFFSTIYQQFLNNQQIDYKLINPILIAFYLRYIYIFRNTIPKQELVQYIKLISKIAKTTIESLRKISFMVLKQLIKIQEGDFKILQLKAYFDNQNSSDFIADILDCLGSEVFKYPQEIQIIELAQSAVELLNDQVVNYINQFGQMYKSILSQLVSQYTFEYTFNLFEGMARLIQLSANNKTNLDLLEQTWMEVLVKIVKLNILDIISFVFQLFAVFVQFQHGSVLSTNYQFVFDNIIQSNSWNINTYQLFPAQIYFIQSMIKHSPTLVIQNQLKINAILQQLLLAKLEQYYFGFAYSLYSIMNLQQLQQSQYLDIIIQYAFNYYQTLCNNEQQQLIKVDFVKHFLMFICRSIKLFTPIEFIKNSQLHLIFQFIMQEQQIIQNLEKGFVRKTVFVCLTDLMFQCFQQMDQNLWSQLLNSLVINIENNQNFKFIRQQRNNMIQINEKVIQGNDLEFKKLSLITDDKNFIQIDVQDEVKYFSLQFQKFYSQTKIDIQMILSEKSQQILTKVIQSLQ